MAYWYKVTPKASYKLVMTEDGSRLGEESIKAMEGDFTGGGNIKHQGVSIDSLINKEVCLVEIDSDKKAACCVIMPGRPNWLPKDNEANGTEPTEKAAKQNMWSKSATKQKEQPSSETQ